MPQETLTFPPLYCIVGAYRLLHDPSLYRPMWAKCSQAVKRASIVAAIWAVCTWPFQRLFVYYFMSASASMTGLGALYGKVVETANMTDDSLPFRIPVPSLQTFATLMFVLGQVHAIMEFWLRRKLRECRNTAYVQTVRSRGKGADWWSEYVEEFSNPPTEKAIKDANKQAWYLKLASPIVRFAVLKVFLLPMDFVPLFGITLGAALRSLSYGRLLHKSFFEAKRMSPFQIELWITERQTAYRSFGFVAALMERIPLVGLIFSISNRIGAAMWAHDLEKRQQAIRGEKVGLEEFKSKPTLKKIYKNVQQETSDAVATTTITGAASRSATATTSGASIAARTVPSQSSSNASGENFTGEGLAVLRRDSSGLGVFTHLSFTFPLKLICPHVSSRNATRSLVRRRGGGSASSGDAHSRGTSTSTHPQAQTSTRSSDGPDSTTDGSKSSTRPPTTDIDPNSSGGEEAQGKAISALYLVGYGGGLVSGDTVSLDVDVGSDCTLLVLTQGSTKVFKTRTSNPTVGVSTSTFSTPTASSTCFPASWAGETRQTFRFLIRRHATLVLLPDPVTCFASARYDQVQRFDLRPGASCVVLDWLTPGRTAVSTFSPTTRDRLDHLDSHSAHGGKPVKDYSVARREPELWDFTSYRSRNEVRLEGEVVVRDVVLLSQQSTRWMDPITGSSFSELARRNHPYGCYATLLLAGPDVGAVVERLRKEFEGIQQRPGCGVEEVLWSLSGVERGVWVVRVAARDAAAVKAWLCKRLRELEGVVGRDLYRQALGA